MSRLTLKQFHILFWTVWPTYLILAMNFLSAEWTGRPSVKSAVAIMARWIPMLDSIQAIAGVNDWIRTFYAGVWLLAPLYVVLGWYQRQQECREKKEQARTGADWVLLLNVLLFYFLGGWMLFYWPIPDVNGWRDRSVASGIFGIAYTVFIMCTCFFSWGLIGRVVYARVRLGHANEYFALNPKQN